MNKNQEKNEQKNADREDLKVPQVPGKIHTASKENVKNKAGEKKPAGKEANHPKESPGNTGGKQEAENPAQQVKGMTGKAQDHDWRNGKPEVSKEMNDVLPSHQTPEMENEADLKKNKGSKPGEQPLEASEEVRTGQSGG